MNTSTRHIPLSLFTVGAMALATPATAQNPAVNPTTGGEAGVDSDADGVHDLTDVEPCNANISAEFYHPAAGVWGTLLFEDEWPSEGDADWNDVVVAHNTIMGFDSAANMRKVRIEYRIMAIGAKDTNALSVRFAGVPKADIAQMSLTIDGAGQNPALSSADADAVITLVPDLHALFGAAGKPCRGGICLREHVNTNPKRSAAAYVSVVLEVHFAPGSGLTAADAPFDTFISNVTRDTEVHRPQFAGTASFDPALFNTKFDGSSSGRHFVSLGGLPYALDFPEPVSYTTEGTRIDSLFPTIVQFGAAKGRSATNFYRSPVLGASDGMVRPGAVSGLLAVDTGCFAANPGVCGSAASTGHLTSPTSGLCSNGTPSAVTTLSSSYDWTCDGEYSVPANCSTSAWVCLPNTAASCSINNGMGTHTCNGSGTGYGSCNLTSCNTGFYRSGNRCLAQVCAPNTSRSCSIANGAGRQTCNNIGSGYGGCVVTSCNSGHEIVNNGCQPLPPAGSHVYYQCENVEGRYGWNTGYVVFVENFNRIRVDTPQQLLDACKSYGFKGLASADSRTHRDIGWGVDNSSDIHQAVYCHNCYNDNNHEWYYNRSSHNSCRHAAGSATGTRNKKLLAYIFNSKASTFGCMTLDQDLDSKTAFGNGSPNDPTHPWFTDNGDVDPCVRPDFTTGDFWDGTPDFLLCASLKIQ